MSPPGLAATLSERRCSAVIPDEMIQDTVDVLDGLGVSRSRSWVMRTIRAWQKSSIGLPFGEALLARLELSVGDSRDAREGSTNGSPRCRCPAAARICDTGMLSATASRSATRSPILLCPRSTMRRTVS